MFFAKHDKSLLLYWKRRKQTSDLRLGLCAEEKGEKAQKACPLPATFNTTLSRLLALSSRTRFMLTGVIPSSRFSVKSDLVTQCKNHKERKLVLSLPLGLYCFVFLKLNIVIIILLVLNYIWLL